MEGTKEIKKLNKGTNEADSKNTWGMLIMHHKHDKHDKSNYCDMIFVIVIMQWGIFFPMNLMNGR